MEAGQKDICSAKPMPQHCHHPRGFCKSDSVEKHLVVRIKVSALDSLSLIPTFCITSQPFKSSDDASISCLMRATFCIIKDILAFGR